MACTFCDRWQESDAAGERINVALACQFYGADVPETVRAPVNFVVTATDTPQQMAAKVTDAIAARAAGFGLAVARNQTLFPALTRGS